MSKKYKIFLLAALLGLGGCTATLAVHENTKLQTIWKPKLIKGQSLDIYFHSISSHGASADDIAAWEKTKLFTSVKATRHDVPTKNGYFLRVSCQHQRWEEDYPFLNGLIWIFTAGFSFAALDRKIESCQMVMYENAIEITRSEAVLSHNIARNGWMIIPYMINATQLNKGHQETSAAIRVNRMLTSLSTMGENK